MYELGKLLFRLHDNRATRSFIKSTTKINRSKTKLLRPSQQLTLSKQEQNCRRHGDKDGCRLPQEGQSSSGVFFFFFKPVQTKVSVLHLSTSPFFYAKEMFDVDNTNFKGSTTRITFFSYHATTPHLPSAFFCIKDEVNRLTYLLHDEVNRLTDILHN